jgi:erythromycin esterase-like protein
MRKLKRFARRETPPPAELMDQVRSLAHPLRGPGDLHPLLDQIGEAHYVLLGEASHGTAEYYTWRSLISRRMIAEQGFSLIAVEGDWPDCYRVT